MRISTSLLCLGFLASGLTAQALTNDALDYMTTTSFTSRSTLPGTSEGWVTMRTSPEHQRGACQTLDPVTNTVVGRFNGWKVVLQDQDAVTIESFMLGLIHDLGSGSVPYVGVGTPDVNNANNLVTAPLSTPAGTGILAWIFTVTLATPFDGVPQEEDIYLGCHMPIQPTWTADGLSMHMPSFSAGTSGDNPSQTAQGANAIYLCVHVVDLTADPSGLTITGNLRDRSHRIWAMTEGANLRVGADIAVPRGANPNFGFGGLYPDHLVRFDGLAFQINDANIPGGITVVFAANEVGPSPFGQWSSLGGSPVPSVQGLLYLNPFTILPIAVSATHTLNGSGQHLAVEYATGNLPALAMAHIAFQAVVGDLVTGVLKLTNAVAFNSL